jgi:sugar lactone lactonase YvrE
VKSYSAFPVLSQPPAGNHLEGPTVAGNRFFWVQIHATHAAKSPGVVHYFEIPEDGFAAGGKDLAVTTIAFDEPVGAVLGTSDPDKVIVALERQFFLVSLRDGSRTPYGPVIDANPDVRLNDCRAGFDGRAYAGTMAYDCETPLGSWGPVDRDADSFSPKLTGIKVSNGFDWTEPKADAAGRAYRDLVYIDSKAGRVDTHDDEAGGHTESTDVWRIRHYLDDDSLGEHEVLANLSACATRQLSGCPVVGDGGTMGFDAGGRAYFIDAEYNGGAGHVIDVETGKIVAEIAIPAVKPTSCCWVGDYLVFTTTREGTNELDLDSLSPELRSKVENSGNLFWCKPGDLHGRPPFAVTI